MRKFILLATLAACAGAADDAVDYGDYSEAQTHQISTDAGLKFVTGVTYDALPPSSTCNSGLGATTLCLVPPKKTVTFKATSLPLNDAAFIVKTRMDSDLVGAGWTVNVVTSGSYDMSIDAGTVSGPADDNIDHYVHVGNIADGGSNFPESPAQNGVFRGWAGFIATIDTAKIAARCAGVIGSTACQATLLDHCVKHVMLNPLGVGADLAIGSVTLGRDVASSRDILPLTGPGGVTAKKTLFSAGQLCRVRNYQLGAVLGTWVSSTSAGCANN
jgi:hypothetical protein